MHTFEPYTTHAFLPTSSPAKRGENIVSIIDKTDFTFSFSLIRDN